jgi:HAD superfamily phosphoserine phosphatase-like hydrolase
MYNATKPKHFLFASDFDQTLSFHDSGLVLSQLLGASRFEEKVAGLAASNLVQQGGELAYLIRHDPDFRTVRREHLIEAGRRVHLRKDIPALVAFLNRGLPGYEFSFYVISAAPKELVESALDGIVPADHIFGTRLDYEPHSGEVRSIQRVPAGYGKVAVLEELERRSGVPPEQTIYVGDGSSDVHVMLHVNNHDGFTIAVSENPHLARIAKSIVLSDSAFAVVVPVLEQIVGLSAAAIQALFQEYQLSLSQRQKASMQRLTVGKAPRQPRQLATVGNPTDVAEAAIADAAE